MTRRQLRRATLTVALAIPLSLLILSATHGESVETSRGGDAPDYFVFDLPSLGGTISEGRNVNNLGMVTGLSDLEGGETRHAALWLGSLELDLGTLGGPNSAVVFNVNSDRGMIVGIAETEEMDPNNEAFSCSAFFPGIYPENRTGHACRGFVWNLGRKRELPTLGGVHGFAASANNRGRVVGWAQTTLEDDSCVAPTIHQFLGVVWNARTGEIEEVLDPLPGDTVTTGNAINDRGQVVGISGDCGVAVGGVSARHAVLWENGTATVLGDLGEDVWNTPIDINRHGAVVGFAGIDGGENLAAFLWTRQTGIQPLARLGEDVHSEAWGINRRGQTVGLSIGSEGIRAVLWRDDEVMNLNDLVQDDYGRHLRTARDINDLGMITGQSIDPETGERGAYLAIPVP
ncbi:MAG: hypothetical protein ACRD2Z_16560 [Thermoanaerobaculia bacterium]